MVLFLILTTIINVLVFGGGGVYISAFEDIFTKACNLVDLNGYLNIVAVTNIFPGLIGGKLAAYGGYLSGGVLGSVLACILFISVPVIVILLIFKYIDRIKDHPLYLEINKTLKPVIIGTFVAIGIQFVQLVGPTVPIYILIIYLLSSIILIYKFKVNVIYLVIIVMIVNYFLFVY